MKPVELFETIADILTEAVGSPYREEELTAVEIDLIVDGIIALARKEKSQWLLKQYHSTNVPIA